MLHDTSLLILAKAPIPGSVKTRLSPILSPFQCASLHTALCLRTVQTAVDSGISRIELWCQPDTNHSFFRFLARRFPLKLEVQRGSDLGERMAHAFESAFCHSQSAIAIGCDCPALDAAYLEAAVEMLQEREVTVGPAEDGGYVLLGLKRATPELFRNIAWGSNQVLTQTRMRLTEAGLNAGELAHQWDLDRPQDLVRYIRARRSSRCGPKHRYG